MKIQRYVVVLDKKIVRIFTDEGRVILDGDDFKTDWTLKQIAAITKKRLAK